MSIDLPNSRTEQPSKNFEEEATTLFRIQADNNKVFKKFIEQINFKPRNPNTLTKLPFLPVEFFKSQAIQTGDFNPETIFFSSGTTNQLRAQHPVKNLAHYHQTAFQGFSSIYGRPENYAFLGLLPSYMENPNASLISMVKHFIDQSSYEESGFFLNENAQLANKLLYLESKKIPTILIGVSFALLDFAEQYPLNLEETIIMETGGMKGRRKELVREELHQYLKEAFNVAYIHAEYGMTELLSQAYSTGNGIFYPPPWMKVLVRDPYDPLQVFETGKGALNIIDLANKDSCAFLATQDLGTVYEDGAFTVTGRFDHADIRGCNLLVI